MALWFFRAIAKTPAGKHFAFYESEKLPVVFDGRLKQPGFARAQFAFAIARKENAQPERGRAGTKIQKSFSAGTNGSRNVMMNPEVATSGRFYDWTIRTITFLKLPGKKKTRPQLMTEKQSRGVRLRPEF